MKYVIDHDYHIHSRLSSCSGIPEQTPERILQYAKENGFKQICLTDHFWDEDVPGASDWYKPQNYAHIVQSLPLPQDEQVKFYFGCECDMDRFYTVGLSKEKFEKFDFIIIPTTHMHMMGFTLTEADDTLERRKELYLLRMEELLKKDLPFYKVGLAHPTDGLLAPKNPEDHLEVLGMVSDEEFTDIFTKIAAKGMGIELNMGSFRGYNAEGWERSLHPYKIAKACGCKFYLGSDAHGPAALDEAKPIFEKIVDLLGLEESDKFNPFVK